MICPICKKGFEGKFGDKCFPFCRETCQLVDLYSWVCEERYVISDVMPFFQEDEDYNIKRNEND